MAGRGEEAWVLQRRARSGIQGVKNFSLLKYVACYAQKKEVTNHRVELSQRQNGRSQKEAQQTGVNECSLKPFLCFS